jgi:TPR repeat protein
LVVSGITADDVQNLNFALPINYVRGQLALAAANPLQPLSEVPVRTQVRVTAVAGNTETCSTSAEELELLKSGAEQGDADAQSNLGDMYDNGDCVPQDFVEAMRWYRLAADQGHASAQYGA